jgi:hypothetical protein
MTDLVTILKDFIMEVEKGTRMVNEIESITVSSKFFRRLAENLTISHTLHDADYKKDRITIYTGVGSLTIIKRD